MMIKNKLMSIWDLIKEMPLKDYFNFKKLSLLRKVLPYTMVHYRRLSNVYESARIVVRQQINGSFIECGVWRGGCAAILGYVANMEGQGRKTWLFDSFKGVPQPTEKDGKKAIELAAGKLSGQLSPINQFVSSEQEVRKILFSILQLREDNVAICKGWFQDTLPEVKNKIGPIAILRLDGDWYESTKICLDNLYDNVVSGGYIIIDDYGYWEGCKKAVDEFIKEKEIKSKLIKIDDTGVFFQK